MAYFARYILHVKNMELLKIWGYAEVTNGNAARIQPLKG